MKSERPIWINGLRTFKLHAESFSRERECSFDDRLTIGMGSGKRTTSRSADMDVRGGMARRPSRAMRRGSVAE
jgi:hypothetical protein